MGKASYLNKRRWLRVRLECFYRDGYRCTKCGKTGRLEAHHIIPLHKINEHMGLNAYTLANLTTLCRKCHIELHRAERLARRPKTVFHNLLESFND